MPQLTVQSTIVPRARRLVRVFALILAIAVMPPSARAQDQRAALRALFPRASEVAGWNLKQEPKFYAGNQVFDYMDGAGEIPRSYDLRELGSAKYAQGSVVLEAVIFDMGRPENAFGYYSARAFLERSPTSKERIVLLDHPAHLYSSVGILTLWKGRYTVIVQPDIGKATDADLIRFGRTLSAKIKEKGRLPEMLRLLPQQGTIPNTERYLRGKAAFDTLLLFTPRDAFGGAKGADAVAVDTGSAAGTYTLCMARYSTPAAAMEALNNLRQYLVTRKAALVASPPVGAFIAMVPRINAVGARVTGRYLAVVVGAKDKKTAETGLKLLEKPGNLRQ